MSAASLPQALVAFLADAAARIAALADPRIEQTVPPYFRAVAASVARQASGGWTIRIVPGHGFSVLCALREFKVGSDFEVQCSQVANMLLKSANPELRAVIAKLAEPKAAILSAFFHYFMTHEFVHVEQGLGSDQYKDSDLYMPVVMEADHVADVAGLAIATHAIIPELSDLDERAKILLLIAIHIASMHSFSDASELEAYAFNRLLIWYLHFARFSKAQVTPNLSSATMTRQWTVTLPRLLGRTEHTITVDIVATRAAAPYPASSDVVLAFHQEDGLYRIYRAALTDPQRITRLCKAILQSDFDGVRIELEELLVNNPALIPTAAGATPGVEWAAGSVIDSIEMLDRTASSPPAVKRAAIERMLDNYSSFARAVRAVGTPSPAIQTLLAQARETVEALAMVSEQDEAREGNLSPPSLRRRALSIVDQIVIEQSAATGQS